MIVIDGEEDEHLEMLEGGVMRQLLDDKWKTFARVSFKSYLILGCLFFEENSPGIVIPAVFELLVLSVCKKFKVIKD